MVKKYKLKKNEKTMLQAYQKKSGSLFPLNKAQERQLAKMRVEVIKLGRKPVPKNYKLFDSYTARSGFEQNRLENEILLDAFKKGKKKLYRKSSGTNEFMYFVNS